MKNILVPTDFSLAAKNAGAYAMHLAREIKTNIKLCNAIMVPVEIPVAAHVATPLIAFETLEQEAEASLQRLAMKMEAAEEFATPSDGYRPAVEFATGIGSVSFVVNDLTRHKDVGMVVMGMSGAGGVTQFLMGSNSRAMVENARLPVLLVPKAATFRRIHKIAFATDLSKADIAVIHVLAGFARTLNAQLLLAHITSKDEKITEAEQKEIDGFLNDITNKVNYPKIYYRHILDKGVDEGLDWLADHADVQVLAMVHRQHSILYRLFKGSHTQRLRKHIEIPLMVFPADCSSHVL
ncbi:nucleotide-binding universal stress UspA family protein [Pedobacter africanus]|uniref:Nucleotide-binding universal stress UspA family protein n=1 Tax=Pedobacter africanus TaxID=151894 RepID=A0ACC6KUF9_9SPHI|nr:universal stress protein [Pedobacter africanus]MDR6782782.1 nucleotide-binding universal stress UspA family protein [Pedobacter africanus]